MGEPTGVLQSEQPPEVQAALETALQEREQLAAQVLELEGRLTAAADRATVLERRWQETRITGALALALQQAHCRDVDAALLLADTAGVTVDEHGAVLGAAEAVAALQRDRGYLFTPRATGDTANPGPGTTAPKPAVALAQWLRGE